MNIQGTTEALIAERPKKSNGPSLKAQAAGWKGRPRVHSSLHILETKSDAPLTARRRSTNWIVRCSMHKTKRLWLSGKSDGGQIVTKSSNNVDDGSAMEWPSCLPPGFRAQPVCGFSDGMGRFSYEFNRVYGPPRECGRRGPICFQDENLSYWCVTWSVSNEFGDSRLMGRSISFAEARKRSGSRMTFDQFFALREQLSELFK